MVASRSKIYLGMFSLLLAVAMAACSVSTAHIGGIQVGKDKDIATPATTFGPHDTVYAKGQASNVDKVTMQWHLIAENVKGTPPNTGIPELDKSFDVNGDSTVDYTLTPSDTGWPPGTYKIVLTMMEDGQQRDQKTQEITIGGS